jgi:protoporphyrin/coproporphyrin ferrochelatase
MIRFIGDADFDHTRPESTAVVITNLGTPDAPTASAVRRYLAQFLSDSRVIEAPRWLWWLVLHGVILRTRPRRSARAYASVWGVDGSPLLSIGKRQARALEDTLAANGTPVPVRIAMRYGNPSLAEVLEEFRGQGLRQLLVLPLYPQYSASTTGSTFDALSAELSRWRRIPSLQFIDAYHVDPGYIQALAKSVRDAWAAEPKGERLLMSFHGLPEEYLHRGDPYFCQCHATARGVANALELEDEEWAIAFQSRVGPKQWLRPYTDETLVEWAKQGVRSVDVVCPGFSADCLETLEEIDIGERARFLDAGGERFRYVEALNDQPAHIDALAEIVTRALAGMSPRKTDSDNEARAARARDAGAIQ